MRTELQEALNVVTIAAVKNRAAATIFDEAISTRRDI
jgi:hypothetical protein